MKKKIYINVLGLAILTILLISSIFVLSFNRIVRTQRAAEVQKEAEFTAKVFSLVDDTVSFLNVLKLDRDLRFTLIGEDGTVLYDSQFEAESLGNHLERPEIEEAARSGKGSRSRLSATLQEETFYYAVQLQNGAFLRAARVNDSMFKTVQTMFPFMLLVGAMTFLSALLVARKLVNGITDRINRLDLRQPMDQVPFIELEPLLKRIEKQNKQISEQMENLLEQEHKFHIITKNMNEGLILLDAGSNIIFINQSCKDLFQVSGIQFLGKHISLFNRSEQLKEIIAAAMKGNTCSKMLDLKERQIQFFGNPVVENQIITGVVLFVLDITEKQKAERLRKEFSANVSHELKTPLTSISGYAELMQNQMAAKTDVPVFAGKIYEEAARLLVLVNDIIKISRLDEGDVSNNKSRTDLYAVAEEVVNRLMPAAEKSQVEILLKGESVYLMTMPQLLYDMIYNLCENGIKYNVTGGKVWVEVSEEEGHPVVCVSDTGIGIPMEYQERIFERFYRIDKSHSKQTGGTGLGLSIVKHVVEYHGGYIEIHSSQKEGTVIKAHL